MVQGDRGGGVDGAYNFPVFVVGGEMWAFIRAAIGVQRRVEFHRWRALDPGHRAGPVESAGCRYGRRLSHRIWIIGDGVIDGQPEANPNSRREVWSSADGIHWDKAPDRTGSAWGGSPVAFDDRLWLIAANRNSTFAPATVVTADGVTWREESAPWPARGAPAVWVTDHRLFLAGGKYSVMENGAPRFIYRNDVWSLARAPR